LGCNLPSRIASELYDDLSVEIDRCEAIPTDRRRRSEPVAGGATRLVAVVGVGLRRYDREDVGRAGVVAEGPVGDVEVPVLPVLVLPCCRQVTQCAVVRDALGRALDDDVEPSPFVLPRRDDDVRVGGQVVRLLLVGTGAEMDRARRRSKA
jgi:hypothetical protein